MAMLDYERLDVYQASIHFLTRIQSLLEGLPRGNAQIADQLRRAALSIPLNIGEGAGKRSPKDRARFHRYARGSAMGCGALLDILLALKLADERTHRELKELIIRVVSMLSKMC